ncbi:uncharacterized protein LOC126814807 [Patella vulgata]|uniref:uncharacterized protein LOC126814807 n=1 Tax=Patella vulgata TaxID=6465 RepID=UPI0021801190|nr:uncharacterized protein LOC126814807 [Patella vulgata]
MTNYCDVEFSWQTNNNKDINMIIDYAVVETKDISSSTEDQPSSFPNHVELSQSGDTSCCEINVFCKSLYKVAITKLEIISESKLFEIYDTKEGYLTTVRGSPLPSNTEESKLYFIDCPFGVPVRSFSGKFVSVARKNIFEIVRLKICLCSCDNELYSAEANSINVPKLKCYVAELGDSVPENAKSLLDAIEQYQTNKATTVDDIKKQLCQENVCQDSSMAGMSRMMAMFSQLNQNSARSSQSATENQLFSMISSVQNGNSEDKASMYSFLQNICGQVSSMRVPPTPSTDSQIRQEVECTSNVHVETNKDMAEAVVNDKLQAMEKQVLNQVDQKINDLEQRLTSKLDLILKGLNIQVPPE